MLKIAKTIIDYAIKPNSTMPKSFDKLEQYLQKILEIQEERNDALLSQKSLKDTALELGLSEEDWNAVQKIADQHLERAKGYSKHKNWTDAIHEFGQVNAIRPHNFQALFGLANAYTQQWKTTKKVDDRKAARKYAMQCLQLDPNHDPSFELINQLKEKKIGKSAQVKNLIILGLLGIIGGLSYIIFLQHQPSEKPENQEHIASNSPLKTATATTKNGKIQVDFLENDLAEGLDFQLSEIDFSTYKKNYNFQINGNFELDGIEVYDLILNFVMYNKKGKIIGEETKQVWQKELSPVARSTDKIPFGLIEHNPTKASPPLSRVVVSIESIDKIATTKTYESADTVSISWEPNRPKNVDVVILERKNKQDFSSYNNSLRQSNDFEIINTGNSRILSMEGRLEWVKKDGSVVASRDNYLLLNFHPNLDPQEARICNFSLYGENIPKETFNYYRVVITSVDF